MPDVSGTKTVTLSSIQSLASAAGEACILPAPYHQCSYLHIAKYHCTRPTQHKHGKTTGKSRLSRWFVNHQKVDGWDEEKLNKLHTETIVLLFVAYICHIVSSPYIELLRSTTIVTILSVIEVICLILGIVCFVKACYVNSSWTAAKLMFDKGCIRTYIFGFWLLRCFIIEILVRSFIVF